MSAGPEVAPAAGRAVSIVIPVRNDGAALGRLLAQLAELGAGGDVVVVDGGSADDSMDVARRHGVAVIEARGGRGGQLAAGCRHAPGRWLWLLHADTSDPAAALTWLRRRAAEGPDGWGRFDVAFTPASRAMALVAWSMNRRSRLTGICTGDQGMFVARPLLDAVGGVPDQPLMEDIELSRRLKRVARPICRPERIVTSPRRWLAHGVSRTILRMWWYRLRYWAGASPEALARAYYR